MATKYLLDTNICVFILRGKHDLSFHIQRCGIDNCYVSEITVAELLYGAECSKDAKKNIKLVNKFCNRLQVVPISSGLGVFAKQKSILRKSGTPIDDFDLLIGSSAIAEKLILVTDNQKHFQRLPLKLENWVERDI